MRDLPLACSLDSASLDERLADLRALGRDAFLGTAADGDLRFRATSQARQRLERAVAAEAACCAFLTLDLHEEAGELRLRIDAPEGAEPVAAGLVEAFSG